MRNWARNLSWTPREIARPTSEEEIQQLVLRAANSNSKIRVIGTGHSFTALCQTNDILISLDDFQGIVRLDQKRIQATVRGGTKLKLLGDLLYQEGMAMENLGDIDAQSIAGTISTGTHGTGVAFGTISTQVVALRLVNGKGEIVYCSEEVNPSLFKAAQVSMGCLGVITEVTIQCIPTYKLSIHNKPERVVDVMANLRERLKDNRNFEFYWFPYTDMTITKTSNAVNDSNVDEVGWFNYWTEYFVENFGYKAVCEYGAIFPSKTESISKFTVSMLSDVRKTQHSHKVYATKRLVRFNEMEYNIPAEAYTDVWKDITRIVNSKKHNVHFPIENRWVKGDDIFMSPAYGRDSAYLACHVYYKKEYKAYFKALEEVFRSYGGRPHWGKLNSLTVQDVEELYPEFSAFTQCRKEQDPDGVFTSPYIDNLLGRSYTDFISQS